MIMPIFINGGNDQLLYVYVAGFFFYVCDVICINYMYDIKDYLNKLKVKRIENEKIKQHNNFINKGLNK